MPLSLHTYIVSRTPSRKSLFTPAVVVVGDCTVIIDCTCIYLDPTTEKLRKWSRSEYENTVICSQPAVFLPLNEIELTVCFSSIMFRCSDILERSNTNDDDDGFDTEEFDSDISDDPPTNEPEQSEYNTQYTEPVVSTQRTFCLT